MKIKWYGTASVSFETENSAIIFDPYIPRKGSETPSAEEEYLNFKDIIITHGHVDHISTLPQTIERSGAKIWCTKVPAETLKEKGIPAENISQIVYGDVLEFGDIKVTVFESRHVKFDKALIISTVFSPRIFKFFSNLIELGIESSKCPLGDEIAGYLIEAEGKRVYLMGSLNWVEDMEYPTDVDLLVLPYQGTSDLMTPAMKFIGIVKPKAVFLDHFDDTFPPLSNHIDTSDIEKALEGKLPITVPVFGETYKC